MTNRTKWDMKKVYDFCNDNSLDLPLLNQKYQGTTHKYIFTCPIHGNYSQALRAKIYQKQGCPKCNGKFLKTSKQYLTECKEKHIDIPYDEYITSHTPIRHICRVCGYVYMQTPDAHLRGQGCPICGKIKSHVSQRKSPEEYENWLLRNTKIIALQPYSGVNTKIKHKCNNCNYTWYTTPHNIKSGEGCPYCAKSHGEKFVENYLVSRKIKYKSQQKFNSLKDITNLSYDFYLPTYNTLIEYQGKQHYEAVLFDGFTPSNLEKQKYHDKLKREYAKNNGYKLLELHYSLDTQDKVNGFLDKYL